MTRAFPIVFHGVRQAEALQLLTDVRPPQLKGLLRINNNQ